MQILPDLESSTLHTWFQSHHTWQLCNIWTIFSPFSLSQITKMESGTNHLVEPMQKGYYQNVNIFCWISWIWYNSISLLLFSISTLKTKQKMFIVKINFSKTTKIQPNSTKNINFIFNTHGLLICLQIWHQNDTCANHRFTCCTWTRWLMFSPTPRWSTPTALWRKPWPQTCPYIRF